MSIFSARQTRKTILTGLALGTIIATLIVLIGQANAGPLVVCNHLGCSDRPGIKGQPQNFSARRHVDANGNDTVIIGGRPAGCPHRYCGCEASLYLFGKIRPMLNVANNWRVMFPRTAPAPQMVAARPGHVFVLISHVAGDRWLVHDGNSGGGLTREHIRSIRGYTIVDPGGSRVAMTSN
jgi:hypothetical protein